MHHRTAPPAERLRIIVLGYIVRGPIGGMWWSDAHYLLGLRTLGHDVYFVEDSDDYPSCFDPVRNVTDTDPRYGLAFAQRTLARVGLGDCWAYHDAHTAQWHGPAAAQMAARCATADLVLNLGGVNPLRPWLQAVPCRVLVDKDPVFMQIRHLTDPGARARALQHTAFFSFGENWGRADCTMPDDGLPWQPTRHPIILDRWPVIPAPAAGKFTTVMQWDSYAAREYNGRRYGMKSDSFGPYLDLPARAGRRFELAVGDHRAPRDVLAHHGWDVVDPMHPPWDPWTYQRYVQAARAEFSIAKHGYVAAATGWFSERSAAYLASGRPVLTQETGCSAWLRTGAGVLTFSTPDAALAGVEDIDRRYAFHCAAARDVAAAYFDARTVLSHLIETALGHPARRATPAAGP